MRTTLNTWTKDQTVIVHLFEVLLEMNVKRNITIVVTRTHVQAILDEDDATVEIVDVMLVDSSHDASLLGILLAWLPFC